MGFDPCNRALKIRESIWNSNSQHGSSLGSVRVHSLTLFVFSGVCDVTPGSLSQPATLQPLAVVTSPSLGLRQLVLMVDVVKVYQRSFRLRIITQKESIAFTKVNSINTMGSIILVWVIKRVLLMPKTIQFICNTPLNSITYLLELGGVLNSPSKTQKESNTCIIL